MPEPRAVTVVVDAGRTKLCAAAIDAIPGVRPAAGARTGAFGNQTGTIGAPALARGVPAMMRV
jgi:hypothetical protein